MKYFATLLCVAFLLTGCSYLGGTTSKSGLGTERASLDTDGNPYTDYNWFVDNEWTQGDMSLTVIETFQGVPETVYDGPTEIMLSREFRYDRFDNPEIAGAVAAARAGAGVEATQIVAEQAARAVIAYFSAGGSVALEEVIQRLSETGAGPDASTVSDDTPTTGGV